ncbi:hypothetical protein MVEN_00227000 [Mycena venus]|uniref:DUF6534 domain-containing protein n=1 Tax=Mycena venus TaxID=2733690 RepID=A0A8H6YXQ3_9AGAR|nr:hypothetical protein MVEN_00227000 [Mycena venus]
MSLTPSQDFLSDNRATIFGPVLTGNILNWLLMCLLMAQLNAYCRHFSPAYSIIRALVCATFLLEFAHTILLTYHLVWLRMVMTKSINSRDVLHSSVIIALACLLTQLIATVVQMFYAWRINSLATTKFMAAIAAFITFWALTRCLSAFTRVLEILGFGSHYNDPASFLIEQIFQPEVPIWSAGGLVPDTLIVICMMFLPDANSSFENKAVSPMAIMAQIGAFSVICAFIDVLLVVYLPSTNYHFIPAYILGKMYSNSLVSILNSPARRVARTLTSLPIVGNIPSIFYEMFSDAMSQIDNRRPQMPVQLATDLRDAALCVGFFLGFFLVHSPSIPSS